MSFFLFFLFWFGLLALAYFYAGRRMITHSNLSRRGRITAWVTVWVLFTLPQIPFLSFAGKSESSAVDFVAWVGYTSLGLFSFVLIGLFARDIILLIRRLARMSRTIARRIAGKTTEATPVRTDRRRFLIHASNSGIMGLAALTTGYGVYEARRKADIVRLSVSLPNLPVGFEGFRIAQITDIHAGLTIKRGFVERIAEQVSALNSDLIAFTGDLVDGSVPWLRNDVAPLTELTAPAGKFFITGNHEYYSGAQPWIEEADRMGFTVLLNEHRIIEKNGEKLVIGGVTDYGAGQFIPHQASDPFKAFSGAPEGSVRILLAHQPKSIFAAAQAGCDLQLSGHTHGGQFFPWNYLATIDQPFIKGLHRLGGVQIYVSRGTGYWGPPVRTNNPPEITLITLTRKGATPVM